MNCTEYYYIGVYLIDNTTLLELNSSYINQSQKCLKIGVQFQMY